MHQIGVGVLGPVFRTYDPDGDRLVALKALHLDITPEQADTLAIALGAIVDEGVSHPALVTPLGAGLADGIPYLALEYVAAESLDVAIRHYAPAAVEAALPFVVQLAEALDAAHAGGLCHGALHLRDVFVTPELARLGGVGVVSAIERVGLRGPLRRPYAAPEQIAGGEWGAAADRFALAAITFELLTGKRAAGFGEQVADQLAGVPGVHDATGMTRLFAAALSDAPGQRPGSARLFADDLADAVRWTGAGDVRRVLQGMDGDAGDPGRQESDETPGTEGAASTMAKMKKPDSTSEPVFDWSERTIDHGESEALREQVSYQPRPPGAAAVGVRPTGERPDDDPAIDGLDTAPDDPSVVDEDDDAGSPTEADGGPLLDQLVVDPDAPTLRADEEDGAERGASRPIEEDDTELYGTAVASGEGDELEYVDDLVAEDDGDVDVDGEGEEVDVSVVQARYRQAEDSVEESDRDGPDSQAAGVYEPISLTDLEERLGEDAEGPDEAGVQLAAPPIGVEALDHDEHGDDGQTSVEELGREDDYDPYDPADDEDDLQAGVIASAAGAAARRVSMVPLVLMALVVTVAAFAVGFGWVAGDGDTSVEPTPAEGVVAGGLAEPVEETAEAAEPVPAPEPAREFSEATVGAVSDAVTPADEPVAAAVDAPIATAPTPTARVAAPTVPAAAPSSSDDRQTVTATEQRVETTDTIETPAAEVPASDTGRLLVRSTLPGVRVDVNGESRGTTPLALAGLAYGDYDVRLSMEGFEGQERRLVISADAPIVALRADLPRISETRTVSLGVGSIFVDTRPRGVEVWLDQRLAGNTPMLIPNVSAGTHEVEFRRDGYRDWATTVQVGPSVQARVTASLDHVP